MIDLSSPVDHLDVSALGVQIRLRFCGALPLDVRRSIARVWPCAASPSVHPDEVIEVDGDDAVQLLSELAWRVTRAAIDRQRSELLMFHAAGVALPDGRVIALVGPSGRGKTTLSQALSRHFGYVSDETIGVSDDLKVHPYRKPFSVIDGPGPKIQVSPIEAGALDLPDAPLRLAAVVLLERHTEPIEPFLEHLPLAQGLPGLVGETSYFATTPRPIQRLAAVCSAVGGIQRLHYSEAESVVNLVPSMVDSRAAEEWQSALEGAPHDAALVDAIEVGDGLVVLVGRELLVLTGIAPVAWRALRQGADLAAVTAAVVQEFGEPPTGDAATLVSSALGEIRSLLQLYPGSEFGRPSAT